MIQKQKIGKNNMEKDREQKELTLKQHYKKAVLNAIGNLINYCEAYNHLIPNNLINDITSLKKNAQCVLTKVIESEDESWKT